MGLLRTKAEPAQASKRARRAAPVTNDQLDAAIGTVIAGLIPDSSTARTLERLWALTEAASGSEEVRLVDSAPVTCAELDEALIDLEAIPAPAGATSALRGVRALIARAEEQTEKESQQYVTRADFDALVDAVAIIISNIDAAGERPGYTDGDLGYRLQRLLQSPGAFGVSPAQRSALRRLVERAEAAGRNTGEQERRHARRPPGQPWAAL